MSEIEKRVSLMMGGELRSRLVSEARRRVMRVPALGLLLLEYGLEKLESGELEVEVGVRDSSAAAERSGLGNVRGE